MQSNDMGDIRKVGFVGLGDQGLPMATAIAEAGYELHVWARRAASMDALGDTPHIRHPTAVDLARLCAIVALCVRTDDDVLTIVSDYLLDVMRPGSVIVNHGTGIPRNAVRVAEICNERGIGSLDAPVSGGRPAAEARTLTALVGGQDEVVARCEPVFRSFANHVVHVGDAGAGQMAKLFNNALLAMNQASIADIVDVAAQSFRVSPPPPSRRPTEPVTITQNDPGHPATATDALAVGQLVLRERQSRDRGWWDDMAACFAAHATIEMSWFTGSARDFMRQTRERSVDGAWGRHRISPPAVRVAGDRAWDELPLGIEFPVLANGEEAYLTL